MKRIRTLTSHAAHARFLAECGDWTVGHVAKPENIPSPYHAAPWYPVLEWIVSPNRTRLVVIFETSHRRYEVFEVPEEKVKLSREADGGIVGPYE